VRRFVLAAAAGAVLVSAPAMAGPAHAHMLFVACRAYGEGRMTLDHFVDAVERYDRLTYARLRFWLLLCGGA
jgi:hypothetical protein